MTPVVACKDVYFRYAGNRRSRATDWVLDGVSLSITEGASVGIVGETGSGKSTLIRILCGLLQPHNGAVTYSGRSVSDWRSNDNRAFRASSQMIFQTPSTSFDPRMSIGQSLEQPSLSLNRRRPSRADLVSWLESVGLNDQLLGRYPRQLSGGQLQRVAIARALSVNPSVLYADEPTSALDVSVQAQVLNLLMKLKKERGITLILVSHDLAVVARLCERAVVMKDGRTIEEGVTAQMLANPSHEYTTQLVAAARAVTLRREEGPAT